MGYVSDAVPGIGTLREKPLHASLKRWYARPGDGVEVHVDGFVIDLVREDLLIEVQTRGFSSMKQKITTLLELGHRVRIVHPIPIDKWIVKVDADGTVLSRRRSPRHGNPTDVFAELVSFPDLLAHPHLEVEVLLTIEEEYRRHTPNRSWRRKGWTVVERRLIEVVDTVLLRHTEDLTSYLTYQYLKERYDADNGFELHRGDYTLVHQLYDSLTTTVNVFGQPTADRAWIHAGRQPTLPHSPLHGEGGGDGGLLGFCCR
ncbi:MAG: hypothetical protein IIA44_10080 [Acidobacteria bacterium]|nr:hypothetical protein [Acidobacteriota bacterium]